MSYANLRALASVVALLFCAPILVVPSSVKAQTPGGLEILAVDYDPRSGVVAVQVRASGSRDVAVEQLTVLVDGVPRSSVADESALLRPSVLLALDASGSMAGAPITAARSAARLFLSQLSRDDRVGLLTFADKPAVLVPIAPTGSGQDAALNSVVAGGGTALHDAIMLGLKTLAESPAPRALVVLSDGEESSDSATTADDVRAAAGRSDVRIHSFALGADAPGEFLRDLSTRTGGSFSSVANDQALAELFRALGGRLGASRSALVMASGLSVGEHRVTVRARVAKSPAEASAAFKVQPAVTLSVRALPLPAPGEPLGFEVDLATTAVAEIAASLLGGEGAVSRAGNRILVDPWAVKPGTYPLLVAARIGGNVVAEQTLEAVIPTLAPWLSVARTATGDWRVEGRAQGGGTIVALADGAEISRSAAGTLTVRPPDEAANLSITLLDAAGVTVLHESHSLEGPSGAARLALWIILLGFGGGIVLAGGLLLWRRRVSKQERETRPLVPRPRVTNRSQPSVPSIYPSDAGPQAWLHVTYPDGHVRRFAFGSRTLLVGSTPKADIHLEGPDVRPDHARFSLTRARQLQVHGVGERGARPYEADVADQWIVVRPGEDVAILDWLFRLELADEERGPS